MFELFHKKFQFKKDKPLRLVELFSGIGFQSMGMGLANIPHIQAVTSEIDKYATKTYGAIHGVSNNLGDISKLKGSRIEQGIDIMTYSFPCTDLSKAGKQKGMGNTRSGLIYEVLRLLQELKDLDNLPKVLIMENVPDLVGAKFIQEFNGIQSEIESHGYSNYVDILNAKNYGIAQNRERVFMVSILGDYYYQFPTPFPLTTELKDYLEDDVDEKYYLSEKMLAYFTDMKDRNGFIRGKRFNPHTLESQYGYTVTTNAGQRVTDNFIAIPEATIKGFKEAYEGDGVYINRPHQKRGVVQNGMIQTIKANSNDIGVVETDKLNQLRIRKLTPRETGRLMGMNDKQIDSQLSVVSSSQAYKQHGNGIVAQVIGLIIGMLVYEDEQELINVVMNNSHDWLNRKV